jgi:hypothetical protein
MRRRSAPGLALGVLVLALVGAMLLPGGSPSAGGVFDARERGCYCHGPDPSESVGFTVDGLPGRYAAGANYTIEILVTFTDVPAKANRSQGGFYLESDNGTLSVPSDMQGLVQVQGLQATHTLNGSMLRRWTVNWTAPSTPGLQVKFYVFVNTADGSRSESFGADHWTMKTITIGVGDAPQVQGPVPTHPPFALETFGLLAVAVAFGAYALWTFRGVRRVAPPDAPDTRMARRPRERRGNRP